MNNCQNANKMNRLMTIIVFVIVTILFCAVILIPTDVAEAETKVGLFDNAPNWQEIYDDYTESIADDWYFDEQYLDLYNAIIEASKMVNDSAFNKEALKNDPIVIALIDTGISAVYDATGAYGGTRCGITQTFINPIEVEYRLHPIFEDVLLTDKNGNYVYYVSAENFTYESVNGTITTIDWFNTGNIAQDMISFDDHGVGVTGIVAYLIHQFGLEDYIKIMPIKADDRYFRRNGVLQLAYTKASLDNAVQWAYDHGADIVNASFSTPATSKCTSLAKDILVVGAAGNSNSNTLNYPSGHEDVLGVMNYVKDEDGNLVVYARDASESYGSTYGEWYDVVAPGETLVIPCYGRNVADYCSYKIMGGTSSSAPIASFASALAMMRYRGYDNYGVDIELTPQVYKEMIPYCSDQVATRVDDNGVVHKFPALDLKNVLTYDFYGDIAFLEKIGVDVDNMLSVSSNTHSKHLVGETITLTADTNPVGISNGKTIGWWYQLNGKTYQIGFGNEIQFKIPEKVGAYKIYSAFVDEQGDAYLESANPIEFAVEYYDHADIKWDVQATTSSSTIERLMVGDIVNITLKDMQLYDPAIVSEIVWRVNYVNVAKGAEFSWSIYASGQYKIYAKVAGNEYLVAEFIALADTPQPPTTITPSPELDPEPPVVDNNDNTVKVAIIVISSVAVAGVIASIAIAVGAKRKKSKKNN